MTQTNSFDDALGREIGSRGQTPTEQAVPSDKAYLRALTPVLEEWNTPEDAAAFDDL